MHIPRSSRAYASSALLPSSQEYRQSALCRWLQKPHAVQVLTPSIWSANLKGSGYAVGDDSMIDQEFLSCLMERRMSRPGSSERTTVLSSRTFPVKPLPWEN